MPSSSSSAGTTVNGLTFLYSSVNCSPCRALIETEGTVSPFSARNIRTRFGFGASEKS